MKLAGILALMAFMLGSCMGSSMKSSDVEFVPIRQPAETVTVEAEPLPPEVVQPESCKQALRYAERIADAASHMYDNGDRQLKIMSEARMQLADSAALSGVEEKQRALMTDMVGNLEEISRTTYSYEQVAEECDKETD